MIGREDEIRQFRGRVVLFQVIAFLALGILGARLFYLQILKGDELRKFSEANRLKKERLFPTRGILYDRHGKVIVDNRAAFDVVLLSQYYSFDDETNARLAKALRMPLDELEKKLAKVSRTPSFYPILLKADVDKDTIAAIEMDSERFSGVDIEDTVQRRYPYGDLGAQLLGYIGEVTPTDIKNDPKKELQSGDYIGKMGIERVFDAFLRGVNGVGYVEVDAMGRRRKADGNERLLGFVSQTDPLPGNNMFLTLDADLQAVAGESMKARNFHGAVIALDPRTGEILAMLNLPSYEPGLISGREINPKIWAELSTNKHRPLRNRAVQDHYPPGSTFKLFLAIAGLAEGKITTKSAVNCNGHMMFGGRKFNCWKRHGVVDFYRSIKESCDIFYYQLGNALGVDTIAKYARMFGFGSASGLKLGSESRGLIPDTEWKKKTFKDIWHPGETLSVAIGQGYVETTPIQLVSAFAALGNAGFLYKPYLVRRIESPSGELIKEFQPELKRKIEIPKEAFDATKEGLYQVANVPGGTAYLSGRSKITEVSGKTGTAQVRAFADIMATKCENMPYDYRHHGWFVGYAPRENPQIAVVAIAEHSCHGSSAAPVVRDVIEAYITKQAALAGQPLPVDIKDGGPTPVAAKTAAASETPPGAVKKKVAQGEKPRPRVQARPASADEADGGGGPEQPPAAAPEQPEEGGSGE